MPLGHQAMAEQMAAAMLAAWSGSVIVATRARTTGQVSSGSPSTNGSRCRRRSWATALGDRLGRVLAAGDHDGPPQPLLFLRVVDPTQQGLGQVIGHLRSQPRDPQQVLQPGLRVGVSVSDLQGEHGVGLDQGCEGLALGPGHVDRGDYGCRPSRV